MIYLTSGCQPLLGICRGYMHLDCKCSLYVTHSLQGTCLLRGDCRSSVHKVHYREHVYYRVSVYGNYSTSFVRQTNVCQGICHNIYSSPLLLT